MCVLHGDIAIIEKYGITPVWRTYITKEMLHDNQLEGTVSDSVIGAHKAVEQFLDQII